VFALNGLHAGFLVDGENHGALGCLAVEIADDIDCLPESGIRAVQPKSLPDEGAGRPSEECCIGGYGSARSQRRAPLLSRAFHPG